MTKPIHGTGKSSGTHRAGKSEQAGTPRSAGRRRQDAVGSPSADPQHVDAADSPSADQQHVGAGGDPSAGLQRADASQPVEPGTSRDPAKQPASALHPGDAAHLYVVLSRAHQWISVHANHDIRKSGLNITEFGVLELLYHRGPQPLQQIGGKILMSSGNITYVIDKLESKGLVVRRASPHDRRVSFAEVTEQGRIFMEDIFPQHRLALEEAVSGLSPEERAQAIELLKKLGLEAQRKAGGFT